MRVLRIYHSGVVSTWRQRERELIRHDVDVELVTAKIWNEGGHAVRHESDGDPFVVGVRTFGHHPNLFVYEPVGALACPPRAARSTCSTSTKSR